MWVGFFICREQAGLKIETCPTKIGLCRVEADLNPTIVSSRGLRGACFYGGRTGLRVKHGEEF